MTVRILLAASLLLSLQNKPQQNYYNVYIIKSYWHTGIVLRNTEVPSNIITVLNDYTSYEFVDFGWGDEVFYQHPDPGVELGAQAILVPTSSVIRIEGSNTSIKKIIDWSDFAIKFELTEKQFLNLCVYIENSFTLDSNYLPVKTSGEPGSRIKFYKSHLKYHLFNTCNKWVADAFIYAGYQTSSSEIITAQNLFDEIYKFGEVLKKENE
ncbi:MAG: DUF2459 domain-containing protein [Ignavibacteria bacterium]|jgi:hypothetical protein